MNGTPTPDPGIPDAGTAAAGSDAKTLGSDARMPGSDAKTPARPVAQVRADIERERAALSASFDALRRDLDEAVDAGTRRAREAGRRTAVIGPAVAGVLAVLVVLGRLVRRRTSSAASGAPR